MTAIIDINKFRNKEILNEDIRYYKGSNELARKLIQTYANDNARSEDIVPPPQEKAILDKYLTGFLNAVVFQYGNVARGQSYSVEELISRWNNLTGFFVSNINPLYSFYVVDKFSNDIVSRVEALSRFSRRGDADDAGVNGDAIELLLRYVRNGVLRPIPYKLLFSPEEVNVPLRALENLRPALEESDDDDDDPDLPPPEQGRRTDAEQKRFENLRNLTDNPIKKERKQRMTKEEKQKLIKETHDRKRTTSDENYKAWKKSARDNDPSAYRIIREAERNNPQLEVPEEDMFVPVVRDPTPERRDPTPERRDPTPERRLPLAEIDYKGEKVDDSYNTKQLKEIAEGLGISKSGNKNKIIERINKHIDDKSKIRDLFEWKEPAVEGEGMRHRLLDKSDKVRRRILKAMPVILPALDAMEGKGKKDKKGKGKKALKDASLGETPSGYATSQSYGQKDSKKTVVASYAPKRKVKKDK
jgi:hypothetical protein